jgi:outer membrane murein-binding lipoprotein Lpp
MPPLPKYEARVTLGNILTVVSMLGVLIAGYINLKLDVATASQQIQSVQAQVKELTNDKLPDRLTVLENTILIKGANRDRQIAEMVTTQGELSSKVDRLQDTVSVLAQNVAALNATLTATARRP